MNKFISGSRRIKIRRSQVLTPFLLLILVLPSLIAVAAPLTEDPISEFTELLQDTQPLVDESIDEEAVIEQAQALLRSQFTQNKGQIQNENILFYGRIPGGMIGFGVSKVFVCLDGAPRSVTFSFVDSVDITPTISDIAAHTSNYFLGDRGTFTNIKSFNQVVYSELWPGIDLIYRATPNGAKYEYHVSANANPDNIVVSIENYDELVIEEKCLSVTTSGMPFHDFGLVAYQDQLEVDVSFAQITSDSFGFNLDEYDISKPIIIDPLLYSTYIGGSSNDGSTPDSTQFGMTVDSSGNAYVTGVTQSSDFPMVNPYNSTFIGPSGHYDSFVFKLNSTGNGLVYSTYIVGSDHDVSRAIAVDVSGNAYITGFTQSTDFPILNAYDSTPDFGRDPFVLKLNSTGNGLVYSTFVAGNAFYETAFDIVVDDLGYAYVAGYTESTNFPRVNAFDSTHNGGEDCFIFKLVPAGNALVFSTFFGGNGDDYARGIALDDALNIYITGYTSSSNLPMVSSLDDTHNGGLDCFVAKFNPSASSLNFSTYVGGSGDTEGWGIAVDSFNQTYVSGITTSSDFPTYSGYDMTHNGGQDTFVFKLNSTGNDFLYSTFVGSSGNERGGSIAIDLVGAVYVTGYTSSDTFPLVNPSHTVYSNVDAFVYKLDPTGQNLLYSTYMGGDGWDYAYQIVIDSSGNAFVAGNTYSSNFPTKNAYDDTPNGASDVFVFKLPDMGDSDSDQLLDYYEVLNGTDRYDPDSDHDNLSDGDEVLVYLTNPIDYDSPGWVKALNYSTFLGGSDTDRSYQVVVDSIGNIYLTGMTGSNDFPTPYGYDTSNNGGGDCFILKFAPNGTTIIYSTFVGGSSLDYGMDLVVDKDGNAFVTGVTSSLDFPTESAFNDTLSGGSDFFVLKLNPTGDTLIFCTYLGGSSNEHRASLEIDLIGNVYISGGSLSSDYPTLNGFDESHNGGNDLVLTKLNYTGTTVIFSTFYGGINSETGTDIAIDKEGYIYIVGDTNSDVFPTVNAYDSSFGGITDGIVVKFHPTGLFVNFSTYLGGNSYEQSLGIELDEIGNICIAGTTKSPDFPTVNAYDSSYNGHNDIFVTKTTADYSSVFFSTFIGGTAEDNANDMTVDPQGNIYVTGSTQSSDFPVEKAYDTLPSGGVEGFVFKLNKSGDSILYSTYISGSDFDNLDSISIDKYGNAFVLGQTQSIDFPVANAYDSTFNGGSHDMVLFKLGGNDDTDFDGFSDFEEYVLGTNRTLTDTDYDTLSDWDEVFVFGTNPLNNDSDSDLIPDGWEYYHGLDPTIDDASDDPDFDSLSNYLEYVLETDPFNDDSDSDSLLDGAEYFTYGTSPTNFDSDFDLMPDGWEIDNGLDPLLDDAYDDLDFDLLINLFEWGNGTLANNNDTDFDKMPDGWEVNNALNATFNDALDDLDMDTLTNLGEYQNGTLPWDPDTDHDTLSDGSEVLIHHTNPLSAHSDADIMPDGWEVLNGLNPLSDDSLGDPDSDLLVNEDEYLWNTDPQNPDSDSDTFTDGYEVHTLGSDPMDPLSPYIQKDPEFSTFIGGSSSDIFYDAIIDSNGNIYLTGYVSSTNFPVVGAYDSTYNGGWDAVVVKLNSTGNGILFSTYIGGSGTDRGLEFYIASDFSVWLSGTTTSSNFPTVNAYDSTYNGGGDGFIIHLSTDGSSLLYSTYIGGSGDDLIEYITFDDDGYLYGSGFSVSSNFPTVSGYDTTFNGNRDAIVFKMQPDMQSFVYSTFVGGSGNDYTYGSRLAANGDFIISGRTTSTNFPTANPYDSTHNGDYDIFVTRLNADGNALVYSTYIGGVGEEYFGKFDIDIDENLFIGGSTASANFPVLNAYDDTHNGGWDAFALKLAANGSSICFSTFVGGSGNEIVYGVEVDHWNNIHLSGVTTSIDLPIVNAFQNESQGGDDTFVFKVNSTGNGLLYSTYLGGSSDDGQRGMAIDEFGRVYIVGWTESADHPTFNAYDDALSGVSDGFVTCLPPLDDSDSDGLPDEIEIAIGSDRFSNDSDSDLMPDAWEYYNFLNVTGDDAAGDEDSDGLLNLDEFLHMTDPHNNDTDSDSMLDGWEHFNGLNPLINDADDDLDSDELTNLQEYNLGSNPASADSDSDLMPDFWEYTNGLNLIVDDAAGDLDSDGLSNLDEYLNGCDPNNGDSDSDDLGDLEEIETYGTLPMVADTDRDLLNDGYEVLILGSNPLLVDSDNDSLSDSFEVLQYGTDPTLYDTDFDGMSDYEEYLAGTDPLVADANDDEDGDGLSNIEEWVAGTDIFDADSDNDGISDFDEIRSGRDPLSYDFTFPMGEFLVIVILISGSVIPALAIVLSNERMYRKTRRVQSRGTESNSDSEKEVE